MNGRRRKIQFADAIEFIYEIESILKSSAGPIHVEEIIYLLSKKNSLVPSSSQEAFEMIFAVCCASQNIVQTAPRTFCFRTLLASRTRFQPLYGELNQSIETLICDVNLGYA